MYEPLKVTAWLGAPIILDRNQPLDGILAATIIESPPLRRKYFNEVRRFQRNVRKYGRENAEAWWQKHGWEIPQEHFVPLAVWGHGKEHGLWVYCSSWAIYDEWARGVTYFNHRFDAELAERVIAPPSKSKKIQTGKGEFKSEHIPFRYRVMEKITWYVRGDGDALEEILVAVRSVGKKRLRGYGDVVRWSVEPVDSDDSVISSTGMVMRPIPVELLDLQSVQGEFQYAFTTYRPPYWDKRYATKCAVGGRVRSDCSAAGRGAGVERGQLGGGGTAECAGGGDVDGGGGGRRAGAGGVGDTDDGRNAAINIEMEALRILGRSGFTDQVKKRTRRGHKTLWGILVETSKMAEERRPSKLCQFGTVW